MTVARKYGLIFNRDKCETKASRIKFFGFYYDATRVHPDPEKALCDGPNSLYLKDIKNILNQIAEIRKIIKKYENT